MNHWIILPLLVPALVAPLIALAVRHDIVLARILLGRLALLVLLLAPSCSAWLPTARSDLCARQLAGAVRHRPGAGSALGADAGADRVLGLFVLLYAINGWDRRAAFSFAVPVPADGPERRLPDRGPVQPVRLLRGAADRLLRPDGPWRRCRRVRAGVQYVVINLVGSTVFLFAVGVIYGVTGTLNMADLAVRVGELAPGDQALLQTGAMLLLLVFAIKAALVPVQFWLPGTYGNAPRPVAALFAIMTKVGAYSIIRMYTLVFGGGAGESPGWPGPWLLPAALVTLLIGMLGVLAARSLGQMVSFAVLGSVGTLLTAVSIFTPQAMSAALFYLMHSTLTAAALFLLVDIVASRRPGQETP
jgi:multicomponent K+:H+ antiporter subunit D